MIRCTASSLVRRMARSPTMSTAMRRRGSTGALAHPGLEHPELPLLDGELGVAHVAVVRLEAAEDVEQLPVDLREAVTEGREGLGVADTGHHVLTLGVDQEVAVLAGGAGRRVPREPDSGPRVVVSVAEHHGLDVHRGAEVVGDPLTACGRRRPEGPFHEANTASMAPRSCSSGSCGKGRPVERWQICW